MGRKSKTWRLPVAPNCSIVHGSERKIFQKPELLATAPNQLWSWDITKLLGPAKWTYFYLYVILDVFSRYIPRN
jgi:transposase InsO family protein